MDTDLFNNNVKLKIINKKLASVSFFSYIIISNIGYESTEAKSKKDYKGV